jgi:1-phosphofructokinase
MGRTGITRYTEEWRKRMITTISLNPAIDKTISITDLIMGGVNRISSVREDIGGKGINVAKILNRWHVPTQVCGFYGSKNKNIVETLLSKELLSYHFLEIDGLTRTNTKIVELDKGITTDLNEAGFYVDQALMQQFVILLQNVAVKSAYTVFSGSIPKGLSNETYKELMLAVQGKTKTVLDADGDLLVEGLKASPYLIKPNLHELETAFHIRLTTKDTILSFCKELVIKYNIKILLVSMGEKGSILITEDACYEAEPIPIDVKSTVGAGDSMISGMLYGITQELPIEKAFAYAAASGTLAVTKEGTQSFSLEEVQEMLKRVHINKL